MPLANRLVWVTGASSGIGEALVRRLDGQGARLVLSARREAKLEALRQTLERPDDHLVLPLDLTVPESHPEAVSRVLDTLGPVDVMIHNGGVSQRSLARDTTLAVDREIFEINFFGTVSLTKALLPSMLERGSGHLVVVSSLVGKIGTPLRSAYAASKHALHGFFDSLRAELYRDGIDVTLVCPGFVRTEISIHARTADGSPQGTMDEAQAQGMTPEACAAEILDAVAHRKAEVLLGGKERWAVHLARFFPGVFRRVIRRAKVT